MNKPPADSPDIERMRRAWQAMEDTFREIAGTLEEKKHERCPYRTAGDECTFRGGCMNKQRLGPGDYRCGGDHLLRREPAQ